jgi:crotonobetainyl-CoA:carnitine CoA-transferase CaiB-like acyl-CoA transferase
LTRGKAGTAPLPDYRRPLKLTATPITAMWPAPGPGQHSVEALGELGYREAELEKLLADEVALQCAEA